MPAAITHHASSFRDPSGYIFEKDGIIYRQVNKVFSEDFDYFISSGCYDDFVSGGLLLPHEVIPGNITGDEQCHRTLRPERLELISYPWEWPFTMMKDAALLTLRLLKQGLEWGIILKDATPFNIQWHKGKLVFIDSLSFEKYDESKPWIAYRQFCEQFLSPLLLAHYAKQPLPEIMLGYPDGIPVQVTSALLPRKTRFNMHIYLHIHLQARYSNKQAGTDKKIIFSKKKLLNLASSLEILVNKLTIPRQTTAWSGYYEEAANRPDYLNQKQSLITHWLGMLKPASTADFGANTGEFSRLAAQYGLVIASDFDPYCIDTLYRELATEKQENICPLVMDISKPSPAVGVNNKERMAFMDRVKVDLGLALALVHHLAIGKNIPFALIAEFFYNSCNQLIIEFIPKQDEKIVLMLKNKADIYTNYNEENFRSAFEEYFLIEEKMAIGHSGRILYRMKRHER